MTRSFDSSMLASVEASAWRRGVALHLSVAGAARPWICRAFPHSLLIIFSDTRQIRDFSADVDSLRDIAKIGNISFLPELAISSLSDGAQIEAQKAERGEIAGRWKGGAGGSILLATPGALLSPLSVGGDVLDVVCGEELSRERLIAWLASKGYERVEIVWAPGQYVARGSIVDLFDPKDSHPLRIEFFDDEIASMRFFATDTQRSLRMLRRVSVQALTSRRVTQIEDFFPADMHVVQFEPRDIENAAENYEWLRAGVMAENNEDASNEKTWGQMIKKFAAYPRLRITKELARSETRIPLRGVPAFKGRRADMEAYCASQAGQNMTVNLASMSEHSREWAVALGYRAWEGSISEGFADPVERLLLIGDMEIAGISPQSASVARRAPADWGERLTPGEWVVHDDYGVALYMGTEQIETEDGAQEYLVLQYAEERRLKVPVMHFHKISPYSAPPGVEPTADNLRGGQWRKASQRAKEQAAEAAKQLMEIYATREMTPGYAFVHGDIANEKEFEKTFPYKETVDQIRAIEEVDADMERSVPMDRLLVGDVGFGKTEVAMRAAAKAVFSGKQVAVMAPTTLLAQQHYDTFRTRFDPFAVRVETLSRFVTPSKQRQILSDLAAGAVDIVVGTHRLLGADVSFRDLGLVVVDEEHRFGVMHKEKLKKLYPSVDVLMLSATPIPRSLHMSLSGLRDLSLLNVPPRERLPVITAVGPWSEPLVKSAVLREKNRGGQIFFVHNRVQSIEQRALMLRRLFPKLSIKVAHGQMPEAELKKTMEAFLNGETDILVCTTIVESGLDIPRANTLIVDDSQELGLAQMYQLRGRVGRREEQAFALFLYPEETKLSRELSERLEAIAEMNELGAGYKLARRDLQIRGGGDFVGIAQHGHVNKVGFQKYCDMLEEAIKRVRGVYTEQTQIEIAVPAAIPTGYLPSESLRVTLYRRLLWIQDVHSLATLRSETADRFGPLPKAVEFLFDVAYVRISGPEFAIKNILCGHDETIVYCDPDGPMAGVKLPPPWMRKLDGVIGPGGMKGINALAAALAEAKRNEETADS